MKQTRLGLLLATWSCALGCGDDPPLAAPADAAMVIGDAAMAPEGGALSDARSPAPDGGLTAPDVGGMMQRDAAEPVDAASAAADGNLSADAGPCPAGMTGPACDECATGYQDADADGACAPGCDATGALAIDCGGSGMCVESAASGLAECACDEGATGTRCETCVAGYERAGMGCVLDDPPPLGLALWLDAALTASLDVNSSMEVTAFRDRRVFMDLTVTPTAPTTRPTFQPTGRNGRGALLFDGVDDQLVLAGFMGLSGTDYEIVFAGEPSSLATPNGLVGAISGTADWAVMLDQHADNDVRLTHRRPPGAMGGTAVSADRTALVRPFYVAASHQSSAAVDTLAIFAADEAEQASGLHMFGSPSNGIGVALGLRIGRTQDGRLRGKLYEVLIYTRRLSVAERAQVATYLRAKWNLP